MVDDLTDQFGKRGALFFVAFVAALIVLGLWATGGCLAARGTANELRVTATSQPVDISQQTGAANVHWTSNLPIGVVVVLWLVVILIGLIAVLGHRRQSGTLEHVIRLLRQVISLSHAREMRRLANGAGHKG